LLKRKNGNKRWQYGVPPAGYANFAWVQHIVHHLAPQELVRSVQTPDRSRTIALSDR
jgi:type I restriction-modification system DNA methylase subunit